MKALLHLLEMYSGEGICTDVFALYALSSEGLKTPWYKRTITSDMLVLTVINILSGPFVGVSQNLALICSSVRAGVHSKLLRPAGSFGSTSNSDVPPNWNVRQNLFWLIQTLQYSEESWHFANRNSVVCFCCFVGLMYWSLRPSRSVAKPGDPMMPLLQNNCDWERMGRGHVASYLKYHKTSLSMNDLLTRSGTEGLSIVPNQAGRSRSPCVASIVILCMTRTNLSGVRRWLNRHVLHGADGIPPFKLDEWWQTWFASASVLKILTNLRYMLKVISTPMRTLPFHIVNNMTTLVSLKSKTSAYIPPERKTVATLSSTVYGRSSKLVSTVVGRLA